MAPHANQRDFFAVDSSDYVRRTLAALHQSVQLLMSRNTISVTIAAGLEPRSSIMTRSAPSSGAIAGIVIGSVVGGSLVLIVLGFLYFRVRRLSSRRSEDDALGSKPAETERRLSFPGPSQPTGKPGVAQGYQVPSILKDGWADQGLNTSTGGSGLQQSPTTAEGNGFAVGDLDFYGQNQPPPTFGNGTDYPAPSQELTFPDDQENVLPEDYAAAAMQGGAADYYDTNVNLDSDPEPSPIIPPSRQMTEMHEQQRREARASRKTSKSSSFSRFRFFKRKRSTRSTEVSLEAGQSQQASLGQDVPLDSIETPGPKGLEQDGTWQLGSSDQGQAQLYEEPQDISEDMSSDQHMSKKSKYRGPSGDTGKLVPHRLNSMGTEATLDPQLPSAALRSRPFPPHAIPQARQSTRFKSPELPEPMELDNAAIMDGVGPAAVRGSHSPPLGSESFVTPMDVMNPTNAVEKAAYNEAELVRIASASPPTSPPANTDSPPPNTISHPLLDTPAQEPQYVEPEPEYDAEESEESDYPETDDEATIPVIEEPIYHGDPSDYSTPAGQSSTNASSGRTPDTRITPTPSPVPSSGFLQPDPAVSPAESSGSPKVLTCDECGRTFDQIHKLNHHKRYHDRKHECPYPDCDKRFGTKTHLDRHINDKHEKKKGFHCTQEGCAYYLGGKQFPRKDNWRRHMQNKHGITPQYDPEPTS
ncbi:hypothetical protein BX600DRAFT_437683 [Xylariales sp. PMI_506]|nr:hypothetical protein BX600DRAFT_437683 [Xylariales sp. PMI_506]